MAWCRGLDPPRKSAQRTDGLVYSDRTPQTCYYEVRKVYSPVVCSRAYLPYPAGPGTNGWISVENRYDQLSLDEAVEGEWRLHADRAVVASGRLDVPALLPHEKGFLMLEGVRWPFDGKTVFWLEVVFRSRRDGTQVYEKSYVLSEDYAAVRAGTATRFSFDRESGRVKVSDGAGRTVLDSPLLLRLDRRPMIGKDLQCGHRPTQTPTSIRVVRESAGTVELAVCWSNVSGRVTFVPSAASVRVDYELTAEAELKVVETGLAFVVPRDLRRFDCVGDGPYEAYPHCSKLSDFGLWSVDREDLYFSGNRAQVRLAAALTADGVGVAVMPHGTSDVAFERFGDSALLGHNAFVAGKGGKFRPPVGRRTLKKGERLSGTLEVFAVSEASSPEWKALFGKQRAPTPFMPFHSVYDR